MGTKVAEIVDSKCEAPGKRPNFAREFKRQLVEQTFEPGASVSLVARRNDWMRLRSPRAPKWQDAV
ncbi:transposase [Caballeronia arationis]|uniref:transposase n=1 Tax=Caballeronia arationis TaxID=1777142 RepID=UPI001F1CDBF8|nr:transposase [Caballeronia arationis]